VNSDWRISGRGAHPRASRPQTLRSGAQAAGIPRSDGFVVADHYYGQDRRGWSPSAEDQADTIDQLATGARPALAPVQRSLFSRGMPMAFKNLILQLLGSQEALPRPTGLPVLHSGEGFPGPTATAHHGWFRVRGAVQLSLGIITLVGLSATALGQVGLIGACICQTGSPNGCDPPSCSGNGCSNADCCSYNLKPVDKSVCASSFVCCDPGKTGTIQNGVPGGCNYSDTQHRDLACCNGTCGPADGGTCCGRDGTGCFGSCVPNSSSGQGAGNEGCKTSKCCDPGASCLTDAIDAGYCCRPQFTFGCTADSDCCNSQYGGTGKCVGVVLPDGGPASECEIACAHDPDCPNASQACPFATTCCTDGVHFGCKLNSDCCSRTGLTCTDVTQYGWATTACCQPDHASCNTDADCCGYDFTFPTFSTQGSYCIGAPGNKTCNPCTPTQFTMPGNVPDAGGCCTQNLGKPDYWGPETGGGWECCAPLGAVGCGANDDCCNAAADSLGFSNVLCGGLASGLSYGWCCRNVNGPCTTNADCCAGWCDFNIDGGGICQGATTPCH
jgi:hypothetical protein